MPCEEKIVHAKTEFVEAVRQGIDALMTHRGYSRERATNALLREINRGAEGSEGRPNDTDIFETMKKYSLGIEEATRALIVSRAIRREWSRSTVTPAEAIEHMVSKISLDAILYESSDDEVFSDDDEQHRLVAIRAELRVDPSQRNAKDTTAMTAPNMMGKSRSSDADIRKNARKRQLNQQSSRMSSKHIRSNSSVLTSSTSRLCAKGNPALAGRKRGIDEMGDRPQQLGSSQGLTGPPRVRSDSVSIEVDAKIASTQRTGANPEGGKVLNDGSTRQSSAKKAHRPADDLVDNETDATATGIDSGIAFGQR